MHTRVLVKCATNGSASRQVPKSRFKITQTHFIAHFRRARCGSCHGLASQRPILPRRARLRLHRKANFVERAGVGKKVCRGARERYRPLSDAADPICVAPIAAQFPCATRQDHTDIFQATACAHERFAQHRRRLLEVREISVVICKRSVRCLFTSMPVVTHSTHTHTMACIAHCTCACAHASLHL